MNPATLGAIAGFFGALVVLGIPLAGFLLRLDRRVGKALVLLLGQDDVDGDGLLARLRGVEGSVDRIEDALDSAQGIEFDREQAAAEVSN